MADIDVRVNELGLQGRCCTQIMVRMALEERGEENEQMAEAVGALCLGLFSGIGCGALAGGALAMWLLAGQPVDGALVDGAGGLVPRAARRRPTATPSWAVTPPRGSRSARRSSPTPTLEAREILVARGLLRD